ncbi:MULTISPECIES: ETEC_3214 domain-containing protein [unclassified Streptomyces]|uniref:Uncharacterized protein n=1 Tax=Streptomyces sp. NBC_00060 TaxID=2975636 RepID=A0AAU2HF77_9ACTN
MPVPPPASQAGVEHWYSTTLNVWQTAAIVGAVIALGPALRTLWRTTIGWRRYLLSRLRQVAPGVQQIFVENLFGAPTWKHPVAAGLTVYVWPLSAVGYLTTWANASGTVVMYGITTRSRWLRPRILIADGARFRLGKTRLSAVDSPQRPQSVHASVGARRFTYFEEHYFGNISGYRHWFIGVNAAGYQPVAPVQVPVDEDTEAKKGPDLERFRARALINTVVVVGIGAPINTPTIFVEHGFGPDQDMVRLTQPGYHAVESRPIRVLVAVRDWRARRSWRRQERRLARNTEPT